MSDQAQILDTIIQRAIKSAVQIQQLVGPAEIVLCTATLPLIIIDVTNGKRQLIPIEIRRDKDTLGWLYTQPPHTNVVFLRANRWLHSMTLEQFKESVEASIIAGGKEFSDTPTADKMHKGADGSINVWIDKEPREPVNVFAQKLAEGKS